MVNLEIKSSSKTRRKKLALALGIQFTLPFHKTTYRYTFDKLAVIPSLNIHPSLDHPLLLILGSYIHNIDVNLQYHLEWWFREFVLYFPTWRNTRLNVVMTSQKSTKTAKMEMEVGKGFLFGFTHLRHQ